MKTKTYQVYSFNELSKEAKEYAIQKWYENEDYPMLKEDLLEELSQLDTLKIFNDVKLSYSLSCCQGDGLSFSANISLENWLKGKKLSNKNIDNINEAIYKFISTGNKGFYSYATPEQIQYDVNDDILFEKVEKQVEDIKNEIASYYMNICKELEKYGYSIIEYRMNDQEFQEFCESNEYEFLENGKID